jgi:hypothetical protein
VLAARSVANLNSIQAEIAAADGRAFVIPTDLRDEQATRA